MSYTRIRAGVLLALMVTVGATTGALGAEGKSGAGEPKKDHHHHSTKKQDLGSTTIAGVKFESITQEGAVVPGKEGAFDVILAEGQKAPKAMRAWIGVASGEGSLKTKLEKEPKRHYHSHVEAPKPLPPGSQYWLEVEPEKGPKGKAGFNFFTEE